jgi:hypothetical protein
MLIKKWEQKKNITIITANKKFLLGYVIKTPYILR